MFIDLPFVEIIGIDHQYDGNKVACYKVNIKYNGNYKIFTEITNDFSQYTYYYFIIRGYSEKYDAYILHFEKLDVKISILFDDLQPHLIQFNLTVPLYD